MTHLWHPPSGLDPDEPESREFWSWIFGQAWFARFEDWERLIDQPDEVDADLLRSAELHLMQLDKIWGLNWHLDGLHAPRDLTRGGWQHWRDRFRTWIDPWLSMHPSVLGHRNIFVARPSDILWCAVLAPHVQLQVQCAQPDIQTLVEHLTDNARCSLGQEESTRDPPGVTTLLCSTTNGRDLEAKIRQILTVNPSTLVRIEGRGNAWASALQIPDRLLYALLRPPKRWEVLTTDDRERLRAAGRWMNSPSGRHLVSKRGRDCLWSTEPGPISSGGVGVTRDLGSVENQAIITSHLLRLKPSDVDPTPDLDHLRCLHHHLFADILSYAGKLRESTKNVIAGNSATVQPSYLVVETIYLLTLFREKMASVKGPAEIIAAIAWFHVRLMSIHPFADGNGHLSRLLLARQMMFLGHPFAPVEWNAKRERHKLAVKASDEKNSCEPLASWLRGEAGLDLPIPEPRYRLSPMLRMIPDSCVS